MTNLSANQANTADKTGNEVSKQEKNNDEWKEIEVLVVEYQKQLEEDATEEQKEKSQQAAEELLERFYPFMKKYLVLLKTGEIDFNDKEMKRFVASFIDEKPLKDALRRDKQKAVYRAQIYQKFHFVKDTYGTLREEEIMIDLQTLLLELARRYKKMGRSFLAYVYNSYRYEVSRHIKKFTKNPLNIPYKNTEFEEYMKISQEPSIENDFEDKYYENSLGIPDSTWIRGESCSDLFTILSPMERKLIIKYYLEDWNDRQISEEFGIHINTVNQKRRQAVAKLAKELNIDVSQIKRNRKSGKKAIMPLRPN